jgi:hypothetical protein
MIRTLSTRLAWLESLQWLRYLQDVYAEALEAASREAGVPDATVCAMLHSVRDAYSRSGAPGPGWEQDVPRATAVVVELQTTVLRLLRQYLDWPVECAVRKTMHDLLLAVAQTVHGPSRLRRKSGQAKRCSPRRGGGSKAQSQPRGCRLIRKAMPRVAGQWRYATVLHG